MSVLLVPRVTVDRVLTHREPSPVIVLVPALRETRVRMVISITYFIHYKICNILRLAFSLRNSRMNNSLLTLTFTCKAVRFQGRIQDFLKGGSNVEKRGSSA